MLLLAPGMSVTSVPTPPRFFVSDVTCEPIRGHGRHLGCGYRVCWSINPHMKLGAGDPCCAKAQHDLFIRALESSGGRVHRLPFIHGAYDSVFAKDNAVLVHRGGGDHALLASPRHPERRVEQRARAAALEAYGVEVIGPAPVALEGGDVVLLPGGRGALLGHGFRSSPLATSALERFLAVPVRRIELRDPALYHLDMAVAVLGRRVLVYPEALTLTGMLELEEAVGPDNVVRVSRAEALCFGLNFVVVGSTVVLASGAPALEARARTYGYDVRSIDLSQFHHAGGSAACLVSRCHIQETDVREDAVEASGRAA